MDERLVHFTEVPLTEGDYCRGVRMCNGKQVMIRVEGVAWWLAPLLELIKLLPESVRGKPAMWAVQRGIEFGDIAEI